MDNGINFEEICEKIEISLLSDEELSDAQKKHIETCDRCRVLLEQNKLMFSDLASLNYTGIEKGLVASKVMENIPKQKISGVPKFRLTHHIGSAAAIVIICAAALIFKNAPTDVSEETIKDNTGKLSYVTDTKSSNNHILGAGGGADEETVEFSTYNALVEDGAFEDANASNEESARKLESGETILAPVMENEMEEASDTQKNDIPKLTAAPLRNGGLQQNVEQSEDYSEDLSDDSIEYTPDTPNTSDSGSAGGAGGGGGSSAFAANNEAFLDIEDDRYFDGFMVFEGIEFLDGEENFDYNIALANRRLSELYGDSMGKVTRFCLENNGWGGNEFFFTVAPSATYGLLNDIKNSSAPITE